jgi:succinate dehydrogenase / fumarate reductase cytochrome b subunit
VVKTVKSQRPVNLDITTIKFPLPAIASILHRISGLAIFFGIAFLIWGLGASLESEESFNALKECLNGVVPKLILWAILAGFIYHFIAGLRHLMMDMGYFETLQGAKVLATLVLVVSAVLIAVAGVWIW